MIDLANEIRRLKEWQGPRVSGRVTHVTGLLIESSGPSVAVGELCDIYGKQGQRIPCQVVGFKDQKVLLMSLGEISSIAPGSEVYPTDEISQIAVSGALRGRILDGLGNPIDGKEAYAVEMYYPVISSPPPPLSRQRIAEVLPTGIKSIDTLLTLGRGQRIGIFAGSGVGKSSLIGMMANLIKADMVVIALIGERGREVRDFIEQELGIDGLARSVVVVATSDQAAPLRAKGANVAMSIAEYFRDQGKHVVLLMDSISRYAMALREIGLAAGEPPAIQGYPPSVFAQLPRLLERAGNTHNGSITGIYTILSEEVDAHDPLADHIRSLLDGHVLLSRELAEAGHFPSVDVLRSLSRVMTGITSETHRRAARKMRLMLQIYREAEDLINIGAYVKGTNPRIDEALKKNDPIRQFLQQRCDESFTFEKSLERMYATLGEE